MPAKGSDSFAARLHFPTTAKAARKQGAVTFYCTIRTDGTPSNIELPVGKGAAAFSRAVEHALRTGRFEPAIVDGRPVSVVIGGTVLFLFQGKRPEVIVTLATADRTKIATMANYIQPQLIGSSAEIKRKIIGSGLSLGTTAVSAPMRPSLLAYRTFDVDYVPARRAAAEVLAHVDAQGRVTGTRVLSEFPANTGFGESAAKPLQAAKFIPALSNGKPVAGDFNLQLSIDATL